MHVHTQDSEDFIHPTLLSLQVRKWRLREGKGLALGHTANEWSS